MAFARRSFQHKAVFIVALFFSILFSINMMLPAVMADRGGFPRISRTRVIETGQRALIAWNGTQEVLILSTDVTSDDETEVVEIMPLPSNPSIGKGDTAPFVKVTELVNTYFDIMVNRHVYFYQLDLRQGRFGGYPDSVTVSFQQTIGMHFLTVVRAEEAIDLVQWLDIFFEDTGYNFTLPSKLEGLLGKYIHDELRYFCIDLITTNSTVKTVDPLIYEFNSSKMYYPLRISNLFSGETSISLFALTTDELKGDAVLGTQFIEKAQFQIRKETVASINTNMTDLFSSNPYLSYFSFSGSQESFNFDILALTEPISNTPFMMLAALNAGCGFGLLLLLFPSKTFSFSAIRELSLPKRIQLASLSAGLVGVCLVWVGFFLPWGLAPMGSKRELLLQFDGGFATSQLTDVAGLIYFMLLIAAVPSYLYLVLIRGDSQKASVNFAALGVGTIGLATATRISVLSSENIGMYCTLTGCALMMLSGLLSVHRLKLTPEIIHANPGFKTYVTRRVLIALVTLTGVLVTVFWLASHMQHYYYF